MYVPENIGSNRVQTHGFGHAQAHPPVFTGNASIMKFAGYDFEWLSIQHEVVSFDAEHAVFSSVALRLRSESTASHYKERDQSEERGLSSLKHSWNPSGYFIVQQANVTQKLSPLFSVAGHCFFAVKHNDLTTNLAITIE